MTVDPSQQQQQQQQNYNELMMAINPIIRQVDRIEERTRDIVTRSDLESLRKELVAQRELEPQLNELRREINRVDENRLADKKAVEKRMDDLGSEQISRQDRLWMRLGQVMAIAAFALTVFQLLGHLRFLP